MANYLFYTFEGYTQAPDHREIDNCQVLGRSEGENPAEALQRLLADNPWIAAHHYTPEAIVACQVVDEK